MSTLHSFRRMAALLAALGLVAAGCGKDSVSPSPGPSLNQEIADDIALQAVLSLPLVGGDLEAALGGQPLSAAAASRIRPARALFDTTYTYGGLTYEASRTYYDASDMALPSYGPTAVRIHWTSRAYGDYVSYRDTAEVGRSAILDVRGIQTGQDTLRFDAANQDTLFARFLSLDLNQMRYFYWTSGLTIANVRVLKSTLQTGFRPLGGTLTMVVSADRLRSYNRSDIEVHLNVTVVITFTGAQQADVVVDGRYRYRWDLDTDEVSRA